MYEQKNGKSNTVLLMILVLVPLLLACNPDQGTQPGDQEEAHQDLPLGVVELTPESLETAQIEIEESKKIEL